MRDPIRPAAASKRFGVSVATLRRWARDGRITRSRVGGLVWLDATEIAAVIAAGVVVEPTKAPRAATVAAGYAPTLVDQDWRLLPFWARGSKSAVPTGARPTTKRASAGL